MNRVAAQAARDKKKAQSTDVERLVAKLAGENRVLRAENADLRQRRSQLESENANLRTRLGGNESSVGVAGAASEACGPVECAMGAGASGVLSGACAVSPAVVEHGLQQRVRALLSTLVLLALSCLCRPSAQASLPRLRLDGSSAWASQWASGSSRTARISRSTLRAIARLQSPSPTLFALRVGKTQQVVLTNSALRRLLFALATRLKQMRFDSRRSMEILRQLPVTSLQPLSSARSPPSTPRARRVLCH